MENKTKCTEQKDFASYREYVQERLGSARSRHLRSELFWSALDLFLADFEKNKEID